MKLGSPSWCPRALVESPGAGGRGGRWCGGPMPGARLARCCGCCAHRLPDDGAGARPGGSWLQQPGRPLPRLAARQEEGRQIPAFEEVVWQKEKERHVDGPGGVCRAQGSLSPECQQWDLLFRRGDPGGQPEVITRTFFPDLQRSSGVGSGVPKEAERHPRGLHFWEGGGLGCVVRSVWRPYLGELAYASGLTLWESIGMCAFILLPSLGEEGSSSLPWLDPSSLEHRHYIWLLPCQELREAGNFQLKNNSAHKFTVQLTDMLLHIANLECAEIEQGVEKRPQELVLFGPRSPNGPFFWRLSFNYSVGTRAFSHDSIFIPDGGAESEQTVQAMSQDNILGKVKTLQSTKQYVPASGWTNVSVLKSALMKNNISIFILFCDGGRNPN
eukprot:bmy_15138T0